MTKTVALLLLVSLTAAGCATVTPATSFPTGEEALLRLKRNPTTYEQGAKGIINTIARAWAVGDQKELARWDPLGLIRPKGPGTAASLDILDEAVWIGTDTITIRASWSKDSVESSGSLATRHMVNFTFDVTRSMTLKAIEGENPFDTSLGLQK